MQLLKVPFFFPTHVQNERFSLCRQARHRLLTSQIGIVQHTLAPCSLSRPQRFAAALLLVNIWQDCLGHVGTQASPGPGVPVTLISRCLSEPKNTSLVQHAASRTPRLVRACQRTRVT